MVAMSCQYLTVKEAAAYLSVHIVTIRNMVKRGELPAIKVSTNLRIAVCDIQRLGQVGNAEPE